MTMENAVLQPVEPVSPVELVSPPVEPVKPLETSPEEILNQKIVEAVSRAVALETEKSKRELQSVKDKSIAEVQAAQRRARLAESTTGAIRTHLQTLDPDVAKEIELAEYRERERQRQSLDQEEQVTRYQTDVTQRFNAQMTQFVTGLGVDPNDPGIDWGDGAPDLLERQNRIHTSVLKIQKEKAKSSADEIDKKIKEAEKRIKKDLGAEDVNSVSTQVSGGVSGEGIPTDVVAFRRWLDNLPQKEYEEKYATKIEEMMRDGKIK